MNTIAAIATATGAGGIGIIRMSGDKCFEILKKIFIPKDKNIDLLLEYAEIFNIYEKVNTIVEVMMKW